MHRLIIPSETLDKRILEYILTTTSNARSWWDQRIEGTQVSRHGEYQEYRLRMEGRRSVADLYHDAKVEPFEGASNVGVGIEGIFAEFLIPLLLANTEDLEPALQAKLKGTKKVSDDLTLFHDNYHRYNVPNKRELVEYSTREFLTTGSSFHKWTYGRFWMQSEVDFPVWFHPLSGNPQMRLDPETGRMLPIPADPKTPKELWPIDPATGIPLKLGSLKEIKSRLASEGPELSVRPVESITFPINETRPDPNSWEFIADDFDVSPYWLLGREGDPMSGKLKLNKLWNWLSIDPDNLHKEPLKIASQIKPIRLRAFHGKYPAASDGSPVEIAALIALDAKLNLGWRPSPFPRRPYFNRQLIHSGSVPLGKGIPETIFSLRSAMDALLNQEIDSGNLYNHPPLLISDLAMLEDEDYEETGPGATWIMRDINGAKFLPTPIGRRDQVELLNWLISNAQRYWGVTDLNLSAPTNSLSPNVKTATGVVSVLNQGSIKFGHFTKRLSSVNTKEYQYVHDVFRAMLANPMVVPLDGNPQEIDSSMREQYFSDNIEIVSVGNGISTNPILRQQTIGQFLMAMVSSQNPFITGDLETYKDLTERWASSFGIDLELKDPQALQQIKIFMELMGTPSGQRLIPAAMQSVIAEIQALDSKVRQPSSEGMVPTLNGFNAPR